MADRTVRIGTRPSAMAVVQANQVSAALRQLDPGLSVDVVELLTQGDRWAGRLADLGGKGAFVRELDRALLSGRVDAAVHCLKDIPGEVPLPEGLRITAFLARDDIHDAVVSRYGGLDDLHDGAVVGTSSVRRTAQLTRGWPQLRVEPIRGNADTRLAKLDTGDYDALVLAVAGLQRIGAAHRISAVIDVDQMVSAVGAGVIAVTTRADDEQTADLVAQLDHELTRRAATAERTMLRRLRGHCDSPIAGLATNDAHGSLHLRGVVYSLDGARCLDAAECGTDPEPLGSAVADTLVANGARDLIDAID